MDFNPPINLLAGKLFIKNKRKGGIELKGIGKFVLSSLIIAGLLIILAGILGIIFGALATGLMLIIKIIPLEIGIAIPIILGIVINIVSKKASIYEDKNKLSFFKEIIIIKGLSENLLRNGHFKVVYVKLANNIKVIGFTTGKVDSITGKIFVFIPTTPVVSTGITILVSPSSIEYSNWTNREALLTIITGGLGSQ